MEEISDYGNSIGVETLLKVSEGEERRQLRCLSTRTSGGRSRRF